MLELYYNNEKIKKIKNIQEVYKTINTFFTKTPEYIRTWYESENNQIVIDYGSWSSFFYIKNLQEKDLQDYYKINYGTGGDDEKR